MYFNQIDEKRRTAIYVRISTAMQKTDTLFAGPDSTIGVERTTNPFLEPFNEKEED